MTQYINYSDYYKRSIYNLLKKQFISKPPMFPSSQPKPQRLSPFKTSQIRSHNRQHSRSPSHRNSRNRSPNTSYSNSNLNTSVHSQHLWNMIEDIEIFPSICLDMLKYQDRNISQFKKCIAKEKNRVNMEMQAFKVEIEHIVEDFRLSVIAILDRIYQQYINKYCQLKSQISEITRLKQQIQSEFVLKQKQIPRSQNNFSNLYTLKTIEQNKVQLKRYQIINYIAEMQKQKIKPIHQIAQYLLVLTQYQNGFFQVEEFKGIVGSVKVGVRDGFRGILEDGYRFIRDPDNIAFKEIGKRDANTIYADNMEANRDTPTLNYDVNLQPPTSAPSQNLPRNSSLAPRLDNLQATQNYHPVVSERQVLRDPSSSVNAPRIPLSINQVARPEQRPPQSRSQPYLVFQEDDSQIQQMHVDYSQQNFQPQKPRIPTLSFQRDPSISQPRTTSQQNREQPLTSPGPLSSASSPVAHSSQALLSPHRISLESLKISQGGSFKSKAMDVILCCLNVSQNMIAVGSRDGSIFLYTRNGNIIRGYENVHKSPVCTLSLAAEGRFLVSGSDHPCPQIIVWEIIGSTIEVYCRFREHKGAVTAIQCLHDSQHIISGSYDKRLYIYSLSQQKPSFTLPSNKNSITSLTLNSNSSKLISCSLQNNSLNIWQIVRSTNQNISTNRTQFKGRVETIFLQQVIQNNTMICSLVSSGVRENIVYIGTKDGRVKIVDIYKGEAVKNMSCSGGNAVIQMLVVEGMPDSQDGRDLKALVLCWPCKESCFKMIDCETGKVSNFNTKGYAEFGCGVGPKATALKDGSGFVVCSQGEDRQIYSYRINRVI